MQYSHECPHLIKSLLCYTTSFNLNNISKILFPYLKNKDTVILFKVPSSTAWPICGALVMLESCHEHRKMQHSMVIPKTFKG